MDKGFLKKKIRAETGSGAVLDELQALLNISKRSVYNKTNGITEFKPSEINAIRIEYNMTDSEVVNTFIRRTR